MHKLRKNLPSFTHRYSLGKSGLRVSPYCVGLVSSSDTYCAAFDAGINFFFLSADMHWPLYEHSRKGLEKLLARRKGIREEIVVAVTIYPTQPEFCYNGFSEVLDAVKGLQMIDLGIIGGAFGHEFPSRLEVFQALRREAYCGIRAIGSTFHDRTAAVSAINSNLLDISFIRYNSSHVGAAKDVFPKLKRPKPSLLYNFKSTNSFVGAARRTALGLNDDYWQPKITDYYRFVLSRPEMDGILCSPSTPAQIKDLAAAIQEGPLEKDEEEHLIRLSALNEGRAELINKN